MANVYRAFRDTTDRIKIMHTMYTWAQPVGGRGVRTPQKMDGPPAFYVAFWWIEYDYVTNCTELGRPV